MTTVTDTIHKATAFGVDMGSVREIIRMQHNTRVHGAAGFSDAD